MEDTPGLFKFSSMLRILLLITGGIISLFTQFVYTPATNIQYAVLIAGIVVLGIPHGAADLLVATQNATAVKGFSKWRFLFSYLSRLIFFAAFLVFFTLPGLCLFLLFAAYHFGETDLNQINTRKLPGKILVTSYGLVLLSVLLVNNLEMLKELLELSGYGNDSFWLISKVEQYRFEWLIFSIVFFICSVFIYLRSHKTNTAVSVPFLLQFAGLLVILYFLPLLLGFTFYFVIWHSVLSLRNIMVYLRIQGGYAVRPVIRQICFFSLLALAGILIAGVAGYMFTNPGAVLLGFIGGLAVLTAPHMQVMHNMYLHLRNKP